MAIVRVWGFLVMALWRCVPLIWGSVVLPSVLEGTIGIVPLIMVFLLFLGRFVSVYGIETIALVSRLPLFSSSPAIR